MRLRAEASRARLPLRFEMEVAAAIRMFADLPPEAELAYFDHVLATVGDGPGGVDERAQQWSAGDLTGILEEQERLRIDAPALHETLLAARNRAWVPRIEAMLGRPGTRVLCVGALHMVGTSGIPTRLEHAGIEVRRP